MKSFRQLLLEIQESPQINTYISKDLTNAVLAQDDVEHLSAKSTSIGNNSFYYVNKRGQTVVFHKDSNGIPQEVNYIANDYQKMVSKRKGTVRKIIDHMIWYIQKYGQLMTDFQQSPGAKHLWINFVKSNPKNIKFEYILENKKQELNSKNIEELKDKIWSKDFKSQKSIVRAYNAK